MVHSLNAIAPSHQHNTEWVADSGASSHLTSDGANLSSSHPPSFPQQIIVGNGSRLPVTRTGHTVLPTSSRSLYLNNVLVSPQLIKNLLSIRRFTTDNHVFVEFDPLGLSVKDLQTRNEIIRCNSSGPLYTIHLPNHHHALAATSCSEDIWHRRLGHHGQQSLSHLISSTAITCNKRTQNGSSLCHACQL